MSTLSCSLRCTFGAVATVFLSIGAAAQSPIWPRRYCPPSIRDDAGGGCIEAASIPTSGKLFPLSKPLFVDYAPDLAGALAGNVGMGTTAPGAQLEVVGNLGRVLAGTVSINAGSTTVIGTGTAFQPSNLFPGAAIRIGDETFTITEVLSPTWLEVTPAAGSAHSGVQAETDGDLLALTTAAQRRMLTFRDYGLLEIGDVEDPGREGLSISTGDTGVVVTSRNPGSPTSLAQILYGWLLKDTLAVGDRAMIALGFFANGMGGDRRFQVKLEAVVEDPDISTKSAALSFLTPSTGNTLPAERMRITGAGNVGIGTANPAHRLQVNSGGIGVLLKSDTDKNRVSFDTSDNNGGVINLFDLSGDDMAVRISAYSPAPTYFDAGDVGIGTSTPSSKLHVVGDVTVTGNLSKGSGSFRIDHPLDPANKYLSHSFVESPDMLDLYNGNVVLGADGTAWVTLPEWFEALNQDFRYQLTSLGAFAPVYVAEKIAQNRFRIAGGTSGLEVSWQVTGIRHDAYARAHRIPVEEAKPAGERGTYLHPEARRASATAER